MIGCAEECYVYLHVYTFLPGCPGGLGAVGATGETAGLIGRRSALGSIVVSERAADCESVAQLEMTSPIQYAFAGKVEFKASEH